MQQFTIRNGTRWLSDSSVLEWTRCKGDAELFDRFEDAELVSAKLIATGGMSPNIIIEPTHGTAPRGVLCAAPLTEYE